jgi:SAM-dependent methyltransferase
MDGPGAATSGDSYTAQLQRESGVWWKRVADVQAPYRWNLRRLGPGFVLDLGCGLGRNLAHLSGNGVGVDHNPTSVQACRERGLTAFTPDEFRESEWAKPEQFDSLLLAHVVEHMLFDEAVSLIGGYVQHLRPSGRLILVTPQEKGFRHDPTHVEFMDLGRLRQLAEACGFTPAKAMSFPFPQRPLGRVFRYNEFVLVARRKTIPSSERSDQRSY